MSSEFSEPLEPEQARRLIRQILETGDFRWTRHAEQARTDDNLESIDCVNVLRGGVVEPPELENGTWRYRVRTPRICVVIAFRSSMAFSVITTWRVKS
jgi:hypothetical protein